MTNDVIIAERLLLRSEMHGRAHSSCPFPTVGPVDSMSSSSIFAVRRPVWFEMQERKDLNGLSEPMLESTG